MKEGRKRTIIDLHTFCVFLFGPILCALSVTTSGNSRSGNSSTRSFTNLKTSSAFSLCCLGTISLLGRSLRLYFSNLSQHYWFSLLCCASAEGVSCMIPMQNTPSAHLHHRPILIFDFALIAAPQGGFIVPPRMKNSRQKKSHFFQRLSLFSILYNDSLKFSENRDKEFKLGTMYFNFPRTGNYITSCKLVI